jgi:hypothetical protein
MLVLPPYDKLNPQDLPQKKKIYMESSTKFRAVKEKLVRCLNGSNTPLGSGLTPEGVRLWKSNFAYNTREKF